jgi:hypothetical protein
MGNPPKERPAVLTNDAPNAEGSEPRPAPPPPEPPPPAAAPPVKKEEDRIPLMWRLSFGALLSLVALVCITLYHQLNNTLSALRSDVANVNAKSAALVSKDEFNKGLIEINSRNKTLQDSIKDLHQANAALLALRERSDQLKERLDKSDKKREELAEEVQRLRERLAVLEARRAKDPAEKKPMN